MSGSLTCAEFEPLAAELALGLLVGPERSDAIDHVASCASCRQLVQEQAMVLDELLTVIPEAEPPSGFEGRVVDALARARESGGPLGPRVDDAPSRRPGRAGRTLRPALAAAALVVIAVVAGVLVVARSHPSEVRLATMLAGNGSPVGSVEVGDVAGNPVGGNAGADTVRVTLPAWADDPNGSPPYQLRVELEDGTSRDLGWFRVFPQQDSWSAPLGGYAGDVRRIVVLNEAGKTLCHGDLT